MIQVINSVKYNTGAAAQAAAPTPVTIQPSKIELPTKDRNYCVFDQQKVDSFVAQGREALPELKKILETSQDEKQIVETLYIIDRLAENKTKGIPHLYPTLAEFNDSNSPNIQVYLAGIYRKTLVPDAFGPLVAMLIKNSTKMQRCKDAKMQSGSSGLPDLYTSIPLFDPNEEVGGAILEYISVYSKEKPKIDYSA